MQIRHRTESHAIRIVAVLLLLAVCLPASILAAGPATNGGGHYTEDQIFASRPSPDGEMNFGNIGVTGLKARIYKGVVVTIEEVLPGTPADGKFKVGQIITGMNGKPLQGKNPFVLIGDALTEAEATDGKLTFDVQERGGTTATKVGVTIPVLGAYSKTWPLKCEKSRKIIEHAAKYYATDEAFNQKYFKGKEMSGALACLFLLSTGDDTYIPRVKEYFSQFLPDVEQIGDNTWHNGYNGIACAEYYLRTGDKEVLPILQYYCDNARDRQHFGCGWTHWGRGIGPGYVAGGLMNPAGAQVLTTLLMAKECGVDVDEKTLLGALRFWYRFAGHGTVPYGDHRPEGGLGSNGKDGMSAAAMLIASGAQGDVTIYKRAQKYLGMSMLTSYPVLVCGHGDEGRGDGIWRGLTSAYMRDDEPQEYEVAMRRLQWWYDLSRRPSGGMGMATCQRFDDEGSGAGVALSYTAPLKTLRITGAPRSKYAKDFKLPEHLWGRAADLDFLSIENNPTYLTYGKPEPTHIPFYAFGTAYSKPAAELDRVPREEILKNVFHARYMIRAQAAKALRITGAFDELETLMQNADPRVRRAALDGIIDYNYWFAMGRDTLKPEQLTPGMIPAIKAMLANPEESLWVVDGALMAMKLAPAKELHAALPLILPWTTHDEWWLRQSAFMALTGMQEEDELLLDVLPTMVTMLIKEYHTAPREMFTRTMREILQRKKNSPAGKMILAGLVRSLEESRIIPGERSAEGAFNVAIAADVCLRDAPERTLEIATIMRNRLDVLDTGWITKLVATPNSNREDKPYGLYSAMTGLPAEEQEALTDMLYNDYRKVLIDRIRNGEKEDLALIDTVLDLTKLKNPIAGWSALGKIKPAECVWRYTSFDPQPEDVQHPREKKRFRDVALPEGMADWMKPDFDDSQWKSGKAPIGVGLFEQNRISFENQSDWGNGEFLLMRTAFELDDLDYDAYRISVLAKQGFHIYLNGHKIHTYIWWKDMPHYRLIMLDPNQTQHLKKGKNVLAAYCNVEYPKGEAVAQIDLYLEGLQNADLE